MKKIFAVLVIALGATIALFGLAGTPPVRDLFPIEFELPSGGLATQHRYFRIVPTEHQDQDYLPYLVTLLGLTIIVIGIAYRRKLRSTAA